MENIDKYLIKSEKPKEVNLFISGGGATGLLYGLGILNLIKDLEKKNYIKIKSISGASAGSVLGYYYLNNKLEYLEKQIYVFNDIVKKKKDYKLLKGLLKVEEIEKKNINDKLFINYIENNNFIVKSKYNNTEELNDAMYKTCFIPFFFEDNSSYKNCYDSVIPKLFIENSNKNYDSIYISLKINNPIFKNRKNLEQITHLGRMDCLKFFSNDYCSRISYISKWSYVYLIFYRFKELLIIIFYIFLNFVKQSKIINFIPNVITQFIKNIYLDNMILIAFS